MGDRLCLVWHLIDLDQRRLTAVALVRMFVLLLNFAPCPDSVEEPLVIGRSGHWQRSATPDFLPATIESIVDSIAKRPNPAVVKI